MRGLIQSTLQYHTPPHSTHSLKFADKHYCASSRIRTFLRTFTRLPWLSSTLKAISQCQKSPDWTAAWTVAWRCGHAVAQMRQSAPNRAGCIPLHRPLASSLFPTEHHSLHTQPGTHLLLFCSPSSSSWALLGNNMTLQLSSFVSYSILEEVQDKRPEK